MSLRKMRKPKIVVGHLMSDQLSVKSVATSKHMDWLIGLDPEELVEFFAELLKLGFLNERKRLTRSPFSFQSGVKLPCLIKNLMYWKIL
ncbi:MAG TPA: hypothetical protein EYM95_14845 [Candidatus Obscuribacterales bacterium]|nr:hypothetical protein [Candidatus Obscuribacterales bacterium]